MKKILLLSTTLLSISLGANAQCTIDTTQVPTGKFFSPDTFPCATKGLYYEQIIQFKVPRSVNIQDFVSIPIPIPYTVFVDSIQIDSITGFPNGIGDSLNPANGIFKPGTGGCAKIAGTTNDPAGSYPLTAHGYITLRGQPQPLVGFDGDTTLSLDALAQLGNSPFSFSIDVINPGAQCRPRANGIATVGSFNAVIKAYPNPTKEVLNVSVNTEDRINGVLQLIDALGRVVITENVDWKGIINHTVEVSKLPMGIYTLRLTDHKKVFQTQVVIQ